jgi:hypothetical protein
MSWSRWQSRRSPRGVSRRAFLGGAAACVVLPSFSSLLPRTARGEGAPPLRLLWYFTPNGMHMPAWTPQLIGEGYDLPPILAPLASVQQHVSVLSGLRSPWTHGEDAPHAYATATLLTGGGTVAVDHLRNAITADQIAAGALGATTPFPSLQLGMEGSVFQATCCGAYPCTYTQCLSWAGPSSPLPQIDDPQLLFDLLFQGLDPTMDEATRLLRRTARRSVLDHVRAEATDLQALLGRNDRVRLDEFLTGVRELELRLQAPELGASCASTAPGVGWRVDWEEKAAVMNELMVLALQCDATRVITFMTGNGSSNRVYDFLGVGNHHYLSHHQHDPAKQAALVTIDTWEVTQFASLIARLAAVQEGDGSLLDHCAVQFVNEISDGDSHGRDDLPVLMAGGAHGQLAGGRHLVYDGQSIGDLHLAMLQMADVPVDTLGWSETPLEGLAW